MYICDGEECHDLYAVARKVGKSFSWVKPRAELIGRKIFTSKELEEIKNGKKCKYVFDFIHPTLGKFKQVGIDWVANNAERMGTLPLTRSMYYYRWYKAGCPPIVPQDLFVCTKQEFAERYRKGTDRKSDRIPASEKLEQIVLPTKMDDTAMKPYRSLAAAVLIAAAQDLIPCSRRIGGSIRTFDLQIHAAERFLSGERNKDDLEFWCNLAGISPEKIKREMNSDRQLFIDRMKRTKRMGTKEAAKSVQ